MNYSIYSIKALFFSASLLISPVLMTKMQESVEFSKLFTHAPESYMYTLHLQFPKNIKQLPKLCGFYKGEPLDFEQNFCIIHESERTSHFSLFVTNPENSPQAKSDKKNIKYLERIADKPYRLFRFAFVKNEKNPNGLWQIKEDKDTSIPLRLADDTIILLANPQTIESIIDNADHLGLFNEDKETTKVASLPTIVFKPHLKQEDVNTMCDISALASLDLRSIHRKNHKIEKPITKSPVIISMRTR